MRAVLSGLASHPCAASARFRSLSCRCASASLTRRASKARRRSGVIRRLTSSISAGSVASAVRGDRKVSFLILAEVPVIAPSKEIERADAEQLGARVETGSREQRMLQRQHDICVAQDAGVLTERMPGRKVHALNRVDHRRLEQFGELDDAAQPRGGPRRTLDGEHRELGVHQQPGNLRHGARLAFGRSIRRVLGDPQRGPLRNPAFLQRLIDGEGHGHQRRRHGDGIGAHRGRRELLERNRLVVPLGEIAGQGHRIPRAA